MKDEQVIHSGYPVSESANDGCDQKKRCVVKDAVYLQMSVPTFINRLKLWMVQQYGLKPAGMKHILLIRILQQIRQYSAQHAFGLGSIPFEIKMREKIHSDLNKITQKA
ncbi:hypothetical protein HMPREF0765_0388 [Sphingobacterium spiritivorum ATCC 33300]|uniref:Uncharacterized protein n=1 Tax=Sphingobacterium spiritivorum ATCC 33300 TaxID=525372 RepID=C2FST2_SPHSI|nr:hypothetical protein HMPREF0765_0388 [Sphingobacterium spiritivorum ATCC 33300]